MSFWISKSRSKRTRARNERGRRNGNGKPIPLSTYLLLVLIWLIAVFLLNTGNQVRYTTLTPGQQAPATVIAEVTFDFKDNARTEFKRSQAVKAVLPVFSINQSEYNSSKRNLEKIFDKAAQMHAAGDAPEAVRQGLGTLLDAFSINLSPEQVMSIAPSNQLKGVRGALVLALRNVWNQGIDAQGSVGQYPRISVREEGKINEVATASIYSPQTALEAAVAQLENSLQHSPDPAILQELLRPWIRHNLGFDQEATERRKQEAAAAVKPEFTTVRNGDPLMDAGEKITPQIIEKLKTHQEFLQLSRTVKDQVYAAAGKGILLLGALFICCAFLYKIAPGLLRDHSRILLFGLLSMLTLLITEGLLYVAYSLDLIPHEIVIAIIPLALAPLLAVILVNSPFAFATGIWTSFAVSSMFEDRFSIFSLGLLLTAIAATTASNVHRRSNVFRAGAWIGAGQAAFMISLAVLNQQHWNISIGQVAAAMASGIVVASLALLVIPLFEYGFKLTTDIRLLELSDMTHPLLQRLAEEAPGTYHHSLMVANLASSAAAEIGGRRLLLRVCAYYHDIGKLTKPEFFIENIHHSDNPHDDLSPSMSTLVIISHVKEGLSMAQNYNLPEPILDAIRQHHGTSVISYFYHRAKKIAKASEKSKSAPDIDDFRYPGPKPQNLEMGILLLADAIEAASRSMEKPSPGHIKSLVNDLVNDKVEDGQLDHCDITFKQLATIKKSFIFNLNNMLHGRIPYPKNEDRDQQSTDAPEDRPDPAEPAEPVAHATGAEP